MSSLPLLFALTVLPTARSEPPHPAVTTPPPPSPPSVRKRARSVRPHSVPSVPTTSAHTSSTEAIEAAVRAGATSLLPTLVTRYLDTLSYASLQRVSTALLKASQWPSVLRVFDIAAAHSPLEFRFTQRIYTDLFFALMKLGGREHAIRAFREWNAIVASGNDARFIGPRSFNFIFVMLSRVGMVDEAMLVRDSCFQNGYYLNRYSYNAFLNACAKSQRIDDAFDTLREMAETSVSPDVVSFNVLISCCVKSGDVDIALKILTRMRNWGIQPDVYSYNSVVNGLRKNQMLDEAFELVAQMERDAASPDPQSRKAIVETVAGVSPDLVTYNTLLSGLAGESCPDLERALRVKKHMEERGLHCNEVSYNALMAAAAKADRTEEAFDIYDEMISRSLKPNCECFTTLITLCGRAHMMDRAFEIHDHMMAAEIAPNVITFNALLTACRNSDADAGDSALKVLNVMHNTPGCDPDVITYSTVIDTLGRNGRFEELKEILTEMKERGIGPNLVTYTSMIAALTRAGDLDRALQLLDDMDRDGVAPNVYTFSSLINGAGRRGEFGKALEILDMMRGRGILPNRITYTMLLQLAGRGGRRELLERVLSEIEGDERMDETSIAKVREHCANGNIFHGGRSRMVVKEIAEIISKRLEKRSSRSQQGDSMR